MMKPLGANQHEGGSNELPSIAQAAETAGIPETSIKSAKAVIKYGAPEEAEAVKLGRKPLRKTADDVRTRRRGLAPPAPPKPKPEAVRRRPPAIGSPRRPSTIEECSDGPAVAVQDRIGRQVAETAVNQALITLKDCVAQRKNGSGIEYRIEGNEEARLHCLLKVRDEEIVDLKNQVAEKDAEIERLTELLTAASPHPTASPEKASVSKH